MIQKLYTIFSLLGFLLIFSPALSQSSDVQRRGALLELGAGGGHTTVLSGDANFGNYSRYGLAVSMGIGYAWSNKSLFTLAVNSNVFVDEVASVWWDWKDKMSGEGLGALGAKIISPFVFAFSPIFRSHSIYGSLEYTRFTREEAPSFLFDGSVGFGLLYDSNREQVFGGFGLSAGAGYEFARRTALNFDIIYSLVENNLSGITFTLALKFYIY